jgi:pyrroloquinoline quinone (PQQ) biosynthesis protein C
MAFCLEVLIDDPEDDAVKVVHTFYGFSAREVQTYAREHREMDKYFDDAYKQKRASEDLAEIDDDEMPGEDNYDDYDGDF